MIIPAHQAPMLIANLNRLQKENEELKKELKDLKILHERQKNLAKARYDKLKSEVNQ